MPLFCFFFQAEDGIRDYKVTGVQTCALPILPGVARARSRRSVLPSGPGGSARERGNGLGNRRKRSASEMTNLPAGQTCTHLKEAHGRAACGLAAVELHVAAEDTDRVVHERRDPP